MTETGWALLVIFTMGAITYGTRAAGVLVAPRLAKSERIRQVLEILPGCAIAAILVPAALRGGPVELAALAVTVAVQMSTGRVLLSLTLGLVTLIGGAHLNAHLIVMPW